MPFGPRSDLEKSMTQSEIRDANKRYLEGYVNSSAEEDSGGGGISSLNLTVVRTLVIAILPMLKRNRVDKEFDTAANDVAV